jgi:hypothetical protein
MAQREVAAWVVGPSIYSTGCKIRRHQHQRRVMRCLLRCLSCGVVGATTTVVPRTGGDA